MGEEFEANVKKAGIPKLLKDDIKHIIAVTSGKGGVGKSFVTGMLAVELRRKGFKVGALDGDLTGSSIARIFGVEGVEFGPRKLIPASSRLGIKIMSMNLLIGDDEMPVVWRGPLINTALKQFYTDVDWGLLDYLLIDVPPGTSDVPLTLYQFFPLDGIIVVSMPQDLATMIVKKAINMAREMNIPILGLIENMSYVVCPRSQERFDLYGPSKGQAIADTMHIPFLGSLPVDPEIVSLCDQGRIEDYQNAMFTAFADGLLRCVEGKT